jgi:hypothetical protein
LLSSEAGLIDGRNVPTQELFSRSDRKMTGELAKATISQRIDLLSLAFADFLNILPGGYLRVEASKCEGGGLKLGAESGVAFWLKNTNSHIDLELLRLGA